MRRVDLASGFPANSKKCFHVFYCVHFLDAGKIYVVKAGRPQALCAEISIVASIQKVAAEIGRKWNKGRVSSTGYPIGIKLSRH